MLRVLRISSFLSSENLGFASGIWKVIDDPGGTQGAGESASLWRCLVVLGGMPTPWWAVTGQCVCLLGSQTWTRSLSTQLP